jgi:hypothetical protein
MGSMVQAGMLLASLMITIGKADAGLSWSSKSETSGGRPQGVEEGFDLVSSFERRVLQPVKWLYRVGGEGEDNACGWDDLGLDAAACERYVVW